MFDQKGSRKEGAEKKKASRERGESGGEGRPRGVRGGKMERLSYETQRQLPRSPPFYSFTGQVAAT